MLTIKKRFSRWLPFVLLLAAIGWLEGCSPSGPRSLLRGKRLMDEGKFTEAIEPLKIAASILSTNANAWNYLGLAYHHANQPANAMDAYQRALKLNHDLVAAHYNLGCLLLEQNKPDTLDGARNELYAYVVRQGNSVDGWLKLGTAQLRLSELPQAEASFKEVLRLNPHSVEAVNDLGVIQLQRRRYRDGAGYFNAALKQQPNYAPAILNLAVTEIYLNNPTLALQKYQEYLALEPRPANWEAVNTAAQQLDLQLNPPRPHVETNTLVAATNPPVNNITRPPVPQTNNAKPETIASVAHTTTLQPPANPPQLIDTNIKPEIVKLPDSPNIKPAGNNVTVAHSTPVGITEIGTPPDASETTPPPQPEKRGFFQKLNPMGLFRHKPPAKPVTTPLPSTGPAQAQTSNLNIVSTRPESISDSNSTPSRPVSLPRYPYLAPGKPAAGNRAESERLIAKAGEAIRDHRLKDAVVLYRSAAQADPSFFDAQSDLGQAAYDSGELGEALRAYEMALAITPDSFSARFNFALALKKANYIADAAEELERLLAATSSTESPAHLALVHLTLANLYADQFHQTVPARQHYLKVLELDPQNSQATAIRYWLQNNG